MIRMRRKRLSTCDNYHASITIALHVVAAILLVQMMGVVVVLVDAASSSSSSSPPSSVSLSVGVSETMDNSHNNNIGDTGIVPSSKSSTTTIATATTTNTATASAMNVTDIASELEVAVPLKDIDDWRRQLPSPLCNRTRTLQRIVYKYTRVLEEGGNSGRKGVVQVLEQDNQSSINDDDIVIELYILGTAHVSNDSSRDVSLLLETLQPSILFLELCDQRLPMLFSNQQPKKEDHIVVDEEDPGSITPTTSNSTEKKSTFWGRFFGKRPRIPFIGGRSDSNGRKKAKKELSQEQQQQQQSMYGMASSLLTNMQEEYADSLGVELGGEFRVAYQYWINASMPTSATQVLPATSPPPPSNNKCHMILGDRPLWITLRRAWESLRLWGKLRLIVGLVVSTFQKPDPEELRKWMESILNHADDEDQTDLLSESIAELATHFPSLERVIIQERDAYMACKLYQICDHLLQLRSQQQRQRLQGQQQRSNQPIKIVAIVGAGHVKGMCQWLTNSTMSMSLSTSPPPSSPYSTGTVSVGDSRTKNNHDNSDLLPQVMLVDPDNYGSPERVLLQLIQTKKVKLNEQDQIVLANDIMEVNPELVLEIQKQQQQAAAAAA